MSKVIDQVPLYLLSSEHMPTTNEQLMGARLQWFGSDSESRYQSAPHPVFKPADVSYHFNAQGYRCPEFAQDRTDKEVTIVAIGASEVLGTGLPEDQVFGHLFARRLENHLQRPIKYFNLGMGGASADYVSRTLASALPVLKPDIVLLVFPYYGRREHINSLGKVFLFNSQDAGARLKNRFIDPENHSQIKAHMTLSSDYNDQMNFYKNYLFCEMFCERQQVSWLYSATRVAFFKHIQHLINPKQLVSRCLGDLKSKYQDEPSIGLGRDLVHPGSAPHKEVADDFFENFNRLYADKFGIY